MLFNKSNIGQEELKELLGFLYASNNFANIKTDIALAEEDMIRLIGQEVYDYAEAHYISNDYMFSPAEGEDGSDAALLLLDDLVHHIQLPVAYYAWYNFSQHLDVTHSEDGRKVILDKDNESMAWEWMLHRDDDATINKAHKTTDRLIAFLEKNEEALLIEGEGEEDDVYVWKGTESQIIARSLFINNAVDFDNIFPIDQSRRFFIKIIPFIKEVERKHILPVLGAELFDELKAAIGDGSMYDDTDTDYAANQALLALIKVPLAFLTLSLAVKRLSFIMMPNGIFQDFESGVQKAKQPVAADVKRSIAKMLEDDGIKELENLQKEITKIYTEALGETYEPTDMTERMDPDELFFRL